MWEGCLGFSAHFRLISLHHTGALVRQCGHIMEFGTARSACLGRVDILRIALYSALVAFELSYLRCFQSVGPWHAGLQFMGGLGGPNTLWSRLASCFEAGQLLSFPQVIPVAPIVAHGTGQASIPSQQRATPTTERVLEPSAATVPPSRHHITKGPGHAEQQSVHVVQWQAGVE